MLAGVYQGKLLPSWHLKWGGTFFPSRRALLWCWGLDALLWSGVHQGKLLPSWQHYEMRGGRTFSPSRQALLWCWLPSRKIASLIAINAEVHQRENSFPHGNTLKWGPGGATMATGSCCVHESLSKPWGVMLPLFPCWQILYMRPNIEFGGASICQHGRQRSKSHSYTNIYTGTRNGFGSVFVSWGPWYILFFEK